MVAASSPYPNARLGMLTLIAFSSTLYMPSGPCSPEVRHGSAQGRPCFFVPIVDVDSTQ
ncbi:hypothetical protein PF005_g4113 [Phytophthora fragariae]|uniref:Uncharacterized protein n=1 Tax=Phytophthora fragariae TaxID=53985 RepID=A0A6A4A642_9STRA|nr:hypothetical protein PF003_g20758 [Phytophthora fragariae]KAE8945767.1 hypothetical protein PF009_g4614 [Phytophthora fragariae]KAE9131549.1 hypothetical protein PF007_g4101 [Phytophthora fragariae]KAE9143053.1 hypothetical protein PF006_g11903 [Phytophthora fragariae]KAE9225830.1 hypothetical protein PF004_g11823 [Phytophthora fragariae]